MWIKKIISNMLYVIKYLLIMLIVTFIVAFFQERFHINNDDLCLALAQIICIFIYYILIKIENKSFFIYLKIKKVNYHPKVILLVLCFLICYFIFDTCLTRHLLSLFPDTNLSDSSINIYFIIGAVILGPICEEILFRGIIFTKLKNSIGIYPALILQAILFGLAHVPTMGNLTQCITAAIGGLVFALLYLKMNNLVIPIIFHGFYNLIVLLFLFIPHINILIYFFSSFLTLLLSFVCIIFIYNRITPKNEYE